MESLSRKCCYISEKSKSHWKTTLTEDLLCADCVVFPSCSPSPVKELVLLLDCTAKETEHRNETSEFCRDELGSELIAPESKFPLITVGLGCWAG